MKTDLLIRIAASALIASFAPLGADIVYAAEASPVGKLRYGSFGFETAGMDRSVAPGDDFFGFANGGWDRTTQIPADRGGWGVDYVLRDRAEKQTRAVIEDAAAKKGAPGSVERKVGDFFASFMDEAGIEAKGLSPLRPAFARIAAISTPAELAAFIGDANRVGIDTPFGISVFTDLKDSNRYSVYLGQGGLGLPDRDYYLDDSNAKFVDTRVKYRAHIGAMLKLAGIPDAESKAQRILALETAIAKAHWTQTEIREMDKIYNPVRTTELAGKMPGLEWTAFLSAAGIADRSQIIVLQPSAISGVAGLAASQPLAAWKDYLVFRVLSNHAHLLSKAFVEENFAFESTVLNGVPKMRDRWRRGVDLVSNNLGEAVGEVYVARHFSPATKAKAEQLVKNLIAAFDARLQNVDWMAPETREKARAKLAAFNYKIGYPDKWRDYSRLEVRADDVVGNVERAARFEYQRSLDRVDQPVDRGEWLMTPQIVNAYANPPLNEIVFPAAILQPPYFDPEADDAVNYGAIGAIIGHEITHHFDDQGRKFDKNGALTDWWTPTDVERFKARSDRLVAQYGAYEALPGRKVNGELTLGENIADLAGLAIAHDAYRISLGGKPAPVIDGFTGDQRFFLGFAQSWRGKYRDEIIQQVLVSDPHSPDALRTRTVRNLDAWYSAFDVKPGQKLYLAPNERVKVW